MISVLGAEKLSLVEIEAFLAASESVRFVGCGRTEIYGWVERLLCHHEYPLQGRRSKGLLRAYVECMTGLSRAQSTRLIGSYVRIGRVAVKPSGRPRYQRHYTPADIELLAAVDEAHERLSGPATRHILKREFEIYGKPEFQRLAALSNGHLYNLRHSPRYGLRLRHFEKTRPTAIQIGERKKPAPNGQPGFLRIDTVHQGDGPEGKGIYHINAVDELTQWEVVLATPRISEAWLMPLLENILQQFPFVILNFHSDNGSEFINKTVAELLEKLLIEQTKSRPRRSGDNGLVETKNAAIVRKHIGWGHIAPAQAAPLNQFYTGFLNPYVHYHRPSAQAEVRIDAKGRKRRLYKLWRTPLEMLLALDRPQQFLRPGFSIAALKRVGRVDQRHRSRTTHATGQKHHVRADKKIGLNHGPQCNWTVEMTVYGKGGNR
jgi:transposase InsO family protein